MDIEDIKKALDDSNPQERMKGIRELRHFASDIAAPLLLKHVKDQEFLVRSFVAMGLGRKRSPESFEALLNMMQDDSDPNVRAEASNSLSFFGEPAVPHLRAMYEDDDHWLVRRSIIAAMADLNTPKELFEICGIGLQGEDHAVTESCISCLGLFSQNDEYQDQAINLLCSFADDQSWRLRLQVAKSLGQYKNEIAIAALKKLKQDQDHRVVGAVLENIL